MSSRCSKDFGLIWLKTIAHILNDIMSIRSEKNTESRHNSENRIRFCKAGSIQCSCDDRRLKFKAEIVQVQYLKLKVL